MLFQRRCFFVWQEIKALRAERFKLLQNDGEALPFPVVPFTVETEDAARAKFSSMSHPVAHTDLKDQQEPHLKPPVGLNVCSLIDMPSSLADILQSFAFSRARQGTFSCTHARGRMYAGATK
jgi:hypothetical protein